MLGVAIAATATGCAGTEKSSSSSSGTPATIVVGSTPDDTIPFKLQTVAVEGHQMAISCKGSGAKTVVFVGDIGQDAMQAWGNSKVPDALVNDATVCVYDRPGLGLSELGNAPRSIENHVKELNGLLAAAGVKTPVVLVSQGFGTIIARQFAKDQRPQVAGLVLIDPPLWALDLKTPDKPSDGVKAEYDYLPQLKTDLGLYGAGALPPPPAPTIVLGVDGNKPPLPDDGSAAPFGPTTTAQPFPPVDKRHEDQKQLAQKTPFGRFDLIDGAGSYAQYWQPEAVTAAIKKVLAGNTR